jgi:hypothetical protein
MHITDVIEGVAKRKQTRANATRLELYKLALLDDEFQRLRKLIRDAARGHIKCNVPSVVFQDCCDQNNERPAQRVLFHAHRGSYALEVTTNVARHQFAFVLSEGGYEYNTSRFQIRTESIGEVFLKTEDSATVSDQKLVEILRKAIDEVSRNQ